MVVSAGGGVFKADPLYSGRLRQSAARRGNNNRINLQVWRGLPMLFRPLARDQRKKLEGSELYSQNQRKGFWGHITNFERLPGGDLASLSEDPAQSTSPICSNLFPLPRDVPSLSPFVSPPLHLLPYPQHIPSNFLKTPTIPVPPPKHPPRPLPYMIPCTRPRTPPGSVKRN